MKIGKTILSGAIIQLMIVLVSDDVKAQGADWVYWDINRHFDTTFTNAQFDSAIDDGNSRLWMRDQRCSDIPCTVQFERNGNVGVVGTHNDGLDQITTDSELNSVFAFAGRVAVVTAVDRCAGTTNVAYIGCGQNGGGSFIVETGVSGNVYIHEYGHNVNLGHRDICTGNIMHSSSNGTNDSLNLTECQALGGTAFTDLTGNQSGTKSTASNPYWANGSVTIPNGQTLTLSAGLWLQVNSGQTIQPTGSGRFVAVGGATPTYIFASN